MLEKTISIIWAIIKNPYKYFSEEMPKDERIKEALIFATVITTVSIAAYTASLIPLAPMEMTTTLLASLVFTPIFTLISLYLSAFFVHLIIFLFAPGRTGFRQSLKVLAYSQATAVLFIIPFIGPLVSTVFGIRAFIFGLSAVHRVSALKIFMLFIIVPIMVLSLLVVSMFLLFGAVLMSQLGKISSFI